MGKTIYLTEKQFRDFIRYTVLNENVYVNDISNGKANITYNKGGIRNKGNVQNKPDYLKTDKMDQQNSDTYEVTLKGGLVCYNITSIKGKDIMHYFKHTWADNKKEQMKFKNVETNQEELYDLTMRKDEEDEFINSFIDKVGFVVKYCYNKFKNQNPNFKFSGLSIYPVPSSSGFNEKMCDLLVKRGFYGMPVQKINTNILKKNLDSIERDEDFINKNKEYYNSPFFATGKDKTSVNTYLDKTINRMRAIRKAQENIPKINELAKNLLTKLAYRHSKQTLSYRKDARDTVATENMVFMYRYYYDLIYETLYLSKFENAVTGEESKSNSGEIFKVKKSTKGPSVEGRSSEVWEIVKPYLRGKISPITKKPYKQIDLVFLDEVPFEIKNFTNGERMGLKNIYTINTDPKDAEMVKQELEKIKGTIFLIFDDNISGGATLGDICYQCKQLGIENIIPITFGEMDEKWTLGVLPLSKPGNTKPYEHSKWKY